MAKARLDQRLVDAGLAPSRDRAKALILSGNVLVNDTPVTKAGTRVDTEATLRVKGASHHWVSRGALKLLPALEQSGVDPTGRICMDIGASTGGFTEVLLSKGARSVYAVDVGYGQLAWKIRQDERVVVLERVNARYLSREQVPERPSLLVCDASFISLTKVIPAPVALCAPGAELILMVKPQFEVGKGNLGSGGVVRDEALRVRTVDRVADQLCNELDLELLDRRDNDIRGPKGNLETFLHLRRSILQ